MVSKPDDSDAPAYTPPAAGNLGAGDSAPSVQPPTVEPAKAVTAAELVSDDVDIFPGTPPPAGSAAPGTPPASAPDKEGEPDDKPKSKRGGARPGAGRPPKEVSTGKVFNEPPRPDKPPVDYLGMSSMIFGMGTGILAQLFGPEWLPRQGKPEQPRPGQPPVPAIPGEAEMVVPCIAKYLESTKMPDIPPGLMLTLVLCAYAAPRFQEPNTREKVKGLWFWIKSKIKRKPKVGVVTADTPRQPPKETEPLKAEDHAP